MTDKERLEQDLQAERHLKEIARLEAEMHHNYELAEAQRHEIEEWLHKVIAPLEKEADWRREQLRLIALGYDFGTKKSRELTHGVFGFRKIPPKLEVVDEGATMQWARTNGYLQSKVIEKYDKRQLLQHVKATGALPEGCELTEEREEFYVKGPQE